VLLVVPASSASPSQGSAVQSCGTDFGNSAGSSPRPGELGLKVAVHGEQAPGESPRVLWTLTLRNRTAKTLGLTFPSSQFADIVLRRKGRTAYRWSMGRGFYQAFTAKTLGPRETYVCTLGPDTINVDGLEQGRYELLAYLTAYGLRVERRGWFSVL